MIENKRDRGDLPSVKVTHGLPTDEDLAALAGVLPTAYREETVEATAEETPRVSDWNRSRRLRRLPGRGPWGRFAG